MPLDLVDVLRFRLCWSRGIGCVGVSLSGFFQPPDLGKPEPVYRQPAWFAAPGGTLPGIVPVERVLAQTDRVAVGVSSLAAYPTGFELDLVAMLTPDEDGFDPMLFHRQHMLRRGAVDEIPPAVLRFGVQFADGSRVTNTGGPERDRRRPTAPVMHSAGGTGGRNHWLQTYWIWPLPPPGMLTFVCEWPEMRIPLSESELDAQLILDAANRAQVLFSDEHLPEPPDEEQGGSAPSAFIGEIS